MAMTSPPPKLLFFVTEDWYFCSHRLPLAEAAKARGFEVALVTRVQAHGDAIEAAGIRLIPIPLSRGGRNPMTEWLTVWRLMRILRHETPDLLHNVALKPVLYGSLAARLSRTRGVINALAGLGHIFALETRAGLLRRLVTLAFRWLLKGHGAVIVQNPDDRQLLLASGAVRAEDVTLIRGSGVDLTRFQPSPETEGPALVLFAARLLWDKGIGEFVAAAGPLKAQFPGTRFVIVGEPDPENHSSLALSQLEQWQREGTIEYWGKRHDMDAVFRECHLVCLPSYYGEGVPKVLLEACAAGRPIVTTDMPGCREVVTSGDNGLLVPPRNVSRLIDALSELLSNPALRHQMGARGRARAVAEFGVERVIDQTLSLYQSLLEQRRPKAPEHQTS